MKVTFTHLGPMHIFCKAITETSGIPYIVPLETSRKTLRGYEYNECGNQSEVIELLVNYQVVACWGDLCERYWHLRESTEQSAESIARRSNQSQAPNNK
jgi:hypothetical protein